jgi:hypothetical protein
MRYLLILSSALLCAAPAAASSPTAWGKLRQQAQRACVQASAFVLPRASDMIVFDDRTGIVAILVTGTHRAVQMKGATGTNLCLYNRNTRKSAVEEARGWQWRR